MPNGFHDSAIVQTRAGTRRFTAAPTRWASLTGLAVVAGALAWRRPALAAEDLGSSKPKFRVAGARPCAEVAIVDQWVSAGWGAVWGLGFRRGAAYILVPVDGFLQDQRWLLFLHWSLWFSEQPAGRHGGGWPGFFDVFAWREPGRSQPR